MVLQKGDFILIEYTAKVKETNEVFDTTSEEVCYLTGPEWVAALNWTRSTWSVWLGPAN